MKNLEFYKSLKLEAKVFEQLKTISYYDFMNMFKELDETIIDSSNSNYTFTNKKLAKIFYKFAKDSLNEDLKHKIDDLFVNFLIKNNDKYQFDLQAIEEYFVKKDENFIKDTFQINSRKQLAKINHKSKIKELKDSKSKINTNYINFLLFLNDFTYKYQKQYINITYKISFQKVKAMNMLFTTNGELFYTKSKGKNLITFNQEKNKIKDNIKTQLVKTKQLDEVEKYLKQSEIYKQGIDYDYSWEVKSLNLEAKSKYIKAKNETKQKFELEISQALKEYKNISKNKSEYFQETKSLLKKAKLDFKEKIQAAVTKSEIKNIKSEYKQSIKDIKSENPFVKSKNFVKYTKHSYKITQNQNKLRYIGAIENIKNKYPIEVKKIKQILAIIFGWIPGVGQFINGQYKKGLLMLLLIPLIILFISYGFGIGNIEGNGILGLIHFGSDLIPVGDSRFFMIEGIIGILLVLIAFFITFMSWFDAKNVAKSMQIGSRASTFSQTRKFLKSQGTPYIMSLPAIIAILFVVLVPIIATIMIAFTNFGLDHDPAQNASQTFQWVGFRNFILIFGGEYFSSFKFVMGWTIVWVIFATVGSLVVGFIAAILINNERLKGKWFFRLVLMLPWAVPAFIMIMIFALILGNDGFNSITKKILGVDGWTREITQARTAIILIQIWLGQSYIFLLITGVLQGISKDLYDSSMMDGANKFKQLIKITIPLVISQIAPLLVGQFVFNFGNFGIIALFGVNGPYVDPSINDTLPGNPGITDILISFVFRLANSNPKQYGIAASFVIVSSIIVIGISAASFKNMKAFKN
ncbi:carbohydrate ABC transporter permease [Mycoplasma capricolum]|uniref:carbohydrate ABC transporter permease n=1 Tax=Mycoplasma capricolum TaxID=2095 RepID=UPI000629FDE9|nr:sugar ABC transporter permease [Mycoplasma capricolum]KKW61762.1 Maltose/maltodextrin ABC transporter, permease protein MalF [Mycoplasma capricolum subsp. capricolum]